MKTMTLQDFCETYLVSEIDEMIQENKILDSFNSDHYLKFVEAAAEDLNIKLTEESLEEYDDYFSDAFQYYQL